MTALAAIATLLIGSLVAFLAGVLVVFLVATWDYLRGLRIGYAPTALVCVSIGAGGTFALMYALGWAAVGGAT